VTVGRKQLEENRVPLKGMYMWGVNSTLTKQSDYFASNDTSERVLRRCDDTVDKKRVNSCVLKYLFGGSWVTKKIAKTPRKCCLWHNNTLSQFRSWRRKKKMLGAVLINPWIRINSGQRCWEVVCFTKANWSRMFVQEDLLSHVSWTKILSRKPRVL